MLRRALFSLGIFLALGAQASQAQHDMSYLKPPPGAHVALIEFADLECPMCARQNPTIKDAAAKYHVPWVRHDFPLQMHVWSFQAAVNGRWFDTQRKGLGNEYRDAIFADQVNIETKDDLRAFTEKFAQQHGIAVALCDGSPRQAGRRSEGRLRAGRAARSAPDADCVGRDRPDRRRASVCRSDRLQQAVRDAGPGNGSDGPRKEVGNLALGAGRRKQAQPPALWPSPRKHDGDAEAHSCGDELNRVHRANVLEAVRCHNG